MQTKRNRRVRCMQLLLGGATVAAQFPIFWLGGGHDSPGLPPQPTSCNLAHPEPGAATHWSWSLGLCLGLILGSALLRIFCEETLVAARYPEYAQYSATTWRMIPYVY